jgi:hypothetical protein
MYNLEISFLGTEQLKLFLHPGIEKTATTTFQKNLFDRHSEIINIGRP